MLGLEKYVQLRSKFDYNQLNLTEILLRLLKVMLGLTKVMLESLISLINLLYFLKKQLESLTAIKLFDYTLSKKTARIAKKRSRRGYPKKTLQRPFWRKHGPTPLFVKKRPFSPVKPPKEMQVSEIEQKLTPPCRGGVPPPPTAPALLQQGEGG